MKLVLASQGFLTDEIAKGVSKLIGKKLEDVNVAVINEAYVAIPSNKDKRWMIKELSYLEKYIGGRIDFVNFRACTKSEMKERLLNSDLIYIVGGKQLFLSKLFRETDTTDLIKEIAKEKVIMGTSAGSIVLGTRITSEEFWKERYDKNLNEIKGSELELVDFNIIPHYMREDHKKWDRDFLDRTLKNNSFLVYAITDTQAIIYDNGKITFCGGEPEIFGGK